MSTLPASTVAIMLGCMADVLAKLDAMPVDALVEHRLAGPKGSLAWAHSRLLEATLADIGIEVAPAQLAEAA